MACLQHAFDAIDQYAAQLRNEANIPGLALGVTDQDKLLRVSTYGVADIAAHIPVSPDTLFEIGSLGKPFTSMALLQLRDEGLLDLHAPVTRYLPWFEVQSDYPPEDVSNMLIWYSLRTSLEPTTLNATE